MVAPKKPARPSATNSVNETSIKSIQSAIAALPFHTNGQDDRPSGPRFRNQSRACPTLDRPESLL